MFKYQDMLDKPLFFVEEGKTGGSINGFLIDRKKLKIEGFLISGNPGGFIPYESIISFGTEALVTEKEKNVSRIPRVKRLVKAAEILDKEIFTEKGEKIGKTTALFFKKETGNITHFLISGGMIKDIAGGKGLLPADAVVTAGSDAMIVSETAREVTGEMKAGGGIKNSAKRATKRIKKSGNKISGKITKISAREKNNKKNRKKKKK